MHSRCCDEVHCESVLRFSRGCWCEYFVGFGIARSSNHRVLLSGPGGGPTKVCEEARLAVLKINTNFPHRGLLL